MTTQKSRQIAVFAMLTVFSVTMGASLALQMATNEARAFVHATDGDNVRELIVRLNFTRER
jgi:hypothetical protein